GSGEKNLRDRLRIVGPIEHHADDEPAERQHDQEVSEILPVNAVGTVRLGRPVEGFAVGKDVGFHQLVETVNYELHDENEQEYRRHLEEQREVDAMAIMRPEPRDERGEQRADDRAG